MVFFKQKTAYEMRISDWSSDVCSSDLINRHTITPNGWTHEQFNTKVLRKPDGSQVELAREFGFNDYQKVDDIEFQPAYDYWKAPSGFRAQVRARWAGFLSQPPGVYMKPRIASMATTMRLFEHDKDAQGG